MRRPRPWTLLTPAVLAFALAAPAAAVADTSGSSNWSGYAVHHSGTAFKHVTGSWSQPTGHCAAGAPTYSAYWVGLGGYAQNSAGIEQLGTELDCSSNGAAKVSAWYELLPAPVRRISMTIAPGDQISGDVTVAGKDVTLTLKDLTRNESFSRTILDHKIDRSSAEWITEAPSQCVGGTSRCKPLPLTDFGSVTFSGADVETATGRTGSISSPLWDSTQIVLARGARYVSTGSSGHEASPSGLRDGGHDFTVAYSGAAPAPSSPPQGAAGTAPASGGTGSGGTGYPGAGNPGGGYYPGGGGYPGGDGAAVAV